MQTWGFKTVVHKPVGDNMDAMSIWLPPLLPFLRSKHRHSQTFLWPRYSVPTLSWSLTTWKFPRPRPCLQSLNLILENQKGTRRARPLQKLIALSCKVNKSKKWFVDFYPLQGFNEFFLGPRFTLPPSFMKIVPEVFLLTDKQKNKHPCRHGALTWTIQQFWVSPCPHCSQQTHTNIHVSWDTVTKIKPQQQRQQSISHRYNYSAWIVH